MSKIAQGKANLDTMFTYYSWNESSFPPDCFRMLGVSNHDLNSWTGTGAEVFGDALEATIVLSVVGDGLPLLYNGQEAGESKRLKFFEKDPIEWREHPHGALYRRLFALKHANTALWNGHWGALMMQVTNNHRTEVLSFVRGNDRDKVFAVFNFSKAAQQVKFEEGFCHGTYTDYFSGVKVTVDDTTQLELAPWAYRVFVQAPR
jgi:hypothetical protein